VLIKITDSAIPNAEPIVKHDWGFAYWNGTAWDAIETPDGVTAEVIMWANTVDPEVLLKEEGKIITLG